jgi:hypothetical protein
MKKNIINKGLPNEEITTIEERMNVLLSFSDNHLSETLDCIGFNDFKEKGFKAIGKSLALSFNIKGDVRFVGDVRNFKTQKEVCNNTSIFICERNVDEVLEYLYANSVKVKQYKTKAGAKKFILNKLSQNI